MNFVRKRFRKKKKLKIVRNDSIYAIDRYCFSNLRINYSTPFKPRPITKRRNKLSKKKKDFEKIKNCKKQSTILKLLRNEKKKKKLPNKPFKKKKKERKDFKFTMVEKRNGPPLIRQSRAETRA